ncbi:MAG: cation diffusion facilitator CzcD-associated flavoprotein CzcO [Saprospiraceae bacterium]|jgi:cation diffusion facilitator CzcD-associated flavoprotein CzcO
MNTIPTLIIGAGPAGLATAGRLHKKGLDFILLEQSNQIAHSWQNHYERLHLHTVKKYSELPFMPFPEEYPNYVPREKLVEYYENYAKIMEIKPVFNEEVRSIRKEDGKWITTTAKCGIYHSQNVVICTGFNRIPFRPEFKNEEEYNGQIIHSRDYRTGKNFKGQKILVVGMGNTGAEIALDLQEQGATAFLSVRGEVNIVPRDFSGRSIQETKEMLDFLPNFLTDSLGNLVQKIAIGNLEKHGIKTPEISPAKQLRELGKTPVLDLGTVTEIKNGNIKVLPDIAHFTKNGLVFNNGEEHDFFAVILATGYRAKVENFLEDTRGVFNEFQLPKQPVFDGGLYFVGFDAYSSGLLDSIKKNSDEVVNAVSRNSRFGSIQ